MRTLSDSLPQRSYSTSNNMMKDTISSSCQRGIVSRSHDLLILDKVMNRSIPNGRDKLRLPMEEVLIKSVTSTDIMGG
jgi:hypothetical protein